MHVIWQVTELEKVQKDHEQITQSLEMTQKTAEDTRLTLVQLQQEHSTVILFLQLFYVFVGNRQIQLNSSGSNTDGSFTTAVSNSVSNSFLSLLEKVL